MPYLIKLKTGHPYKRMQRDGIVVGETVPVILGTLSKAIKNEPFFDIATLDDEAAISMAKKGVVYFNNAKDKQKIDVRAVAPSKSQEKPKGKK